LCSSYITSSDIQFPERIHYISYERVGRAPRL
jgi:hypothetical protein